ncbi:MAG: carboxypeptidase-like regulatory domain-containing protein, partial [Thermoanaerobaculia bacterium]|nr:carboxypeptidase-like regulatory domain-containing protein [Thermoanaerobaculia bacterium]
MSREIRAERSSFLTTRILAGTALGCALLFAGLSLADPETFFSGTVLDASTGRPLAGATVQVTASDGAPPAGTLQVTTGADGRFQLTVNAGLHDVTISHPERVPVFRLVSASAGQGTDVLDPRLEKLAARKTLGVAG